MVLVVRNFSDVVFVVVFCDVTGLGAGNWLNETTTRTPAEIGVVTTANSKIIIDSPDDIMPIQSDTESVRSSVIFFSASLSMFAAIGIIIFFRKCVNCPTRRHGHRRHYYPASEAALRTVGDFTTGPNVVTAIETDIMLDVTGLDATTIPSLAKASSEEDDDEINSPTGSPRRQPLLGLADSTFRFYDDDDNDQTVGT